MKTLDKHKIYITAINSFITIGLIMLIFFRLKKIGDGDLTIWILSGYLGPVILLPLFVINILNYKKNKNKNILISITIASIICFLTIFFTTLDIAGKSNYGVTTLFYIIGPFISISTLSITWK